MSEELEHNDRITTLLCSWASDAGPQTGGSSAKGGDSSIYCIGFLQEGDWGRIGG